MTRVDAALAAALRAPIRLYQVAIGPLLPRVCRFEPTCSAYALEAIGRHGPSRG
ncbi:MAG TPA: membrane protein insertion efficiency factor YidD, partial [Candidatus Edwardsbacteria bacterium]|nr:membrane protein insertion efficiency factor YidD [Candidatus Edwardsbacteria bacterium]